MPKSVKKKIKVIHHNTRPKQALWIDFEVSRNFFPTQFFFKKLRFFFLMFIYLFGCTKSSLWHSGSSTFIAPCGTFSCSMRTLSCGMRDQVPWPGIEPWPPAWGAWILTTEPPGKPRPPILYAYCYFPHYWLCQECSRPATWLEFRRTQHTVALTAGIYDRGSIRTHSQIIGKKRVERNPCAGLLMYEGSYKAHSSPQEQHVCNAMASIGLSEH